MAKNEYSGKPIMWLSLDYKKCMWMHSVKTTDEKEIAHLESIGYERREVENKKEGTITVKYCKTWPSVTGYLTGCKIEDGPFGQTLSFKIEDEDEINILTIPLFGNGRMGGYAVDFIKHIGNIPFNEKITMGLNRNLTNDAGYKVQLLTIVYEERKGQDGRNLLVKRVLDKDSMPPLKKYMLAGKESYDSRERDQFLVEILEKFIADVDKNKIVVPSRQDKVEPKSDKENVQYTPSASSNTTKPSNASPAKEPSYEISPQQEIDDLPF